MGSTRRVLVVGYPAAELLDIACVTASMQMANYLRGRAIYGLRLASPGGAAIRTATGLVVNAELALERARGPLDTLIVCGGIGYVDAMRDERLVAHVRRLGREARRVASVCTGAGVLAAAGLLDGRRVATHWHHAAYLQTRFPQVRFDSDPIFIAEGDVCTSAGVTAALDLMLAFIEADEGPALARDVSRHLVTYLQRPGNQAQMSMFTAPPAIRHALVRDTVAYISSHLREDLAAATLARLAGVSERHLARLFRRQLGVTPGRFVRRARVEAAAHLLTGTDLTVAAIAGRCGFGTVEALRQAFVATYGVSPSHYRATQSTSGDRADATTPADRASS
ncbi:Transcriptional regulator GlxA family, contains an amidase domain and an AraC-type DNA-binding HTH domain [Micromonospora echinaurantiaca]|uniref:Transcriptional regulator GlxA family, contains an amidase domain and an AraC-type DNA-binding HTH domain n=1 Tax=Micromonospora echinaurantiaca TaxID=47857 RepID=A0A1C5HF94_9ACTN|nr:helix-turn-helix domain-containing protein [Micromonospora echinaurantiaca]SCG44682.1 Transcriptional regulator GlxA family, contains an amidase domain and an AraC-type DNA-binding HTH domain [Micromonospora echinaurantiaca]